MGNDDDVPESLAEFAFDLSLRGLGQQERVLEELRARSGTLLAAASLVASFLGGRALDSEGLSPLNIAAGIAFLLTIAGTVYIIAPKENLSSRCSASPSMSTSPKEVRISTRCGEPWLSGSIT